MAQCVPSPPVRPHFSLSVCLLLPLDSHIYIFFLIYIFLQGIKQPWMLMDSQMTFLREPRGGGWGGGLLETCFFSVFLQ